MIYQFVTRTSHRRQLRKFSHDYRFSRIDFIFLTILYQVGSDLTRDNFLRIALWIGLERLSRGDYLMTFSARIIPRKGNPHLAFIVYGIYRNAYY